MGKLRSASLVAALFLLLGLGVFDRTDRPGEGFSSDRGVGSFLRAQGLDPAQFVIQRGLRNYAGPHCPGPSWTCTTALKVVQVGSVNQGECANPCVIVQGSPNPPADNEAKCEKETKTAVDVLECSITQMNSSGTNRAEIEMRAEAEQGTPQDQTLKATIKQTNVTGSNFATTSLSVRQQIEQSAATMFQRAVTNSQTIQTAGSGRNSATLFERHEQQAQSNVVANVHQIGDFNIPPDVPSSTDVIKQTSTGVSTANADLKAQQQAEVPAGSTVNQHVYGMNCCSPQFTNPQNRFDIVEAVDQVARTNENRESDRGGTTSVGGTTSGGGTTYVGVTNPGGVTQTDNINCDFDSTGHGDCHQTVTRNGATTTNACNNKSTCHIKILCPPAVTEGTGLAVTGGTGCAAVGPTTSVWRPVKDQALI